MSFLLLIGFLATGGVTYNGEKLNIDPLLVAGFVLLLFLFGITWGIIWKITRPYNEMKWKEREEDHQRWVQARNAWDRLYYCILHDIVFLAGKNEKYVSTSQMGSLLYP